MATFLASSSILIDENGKFSVSFFVEASVRGFSLIIVSSVFFSIFFAALVFVFVVSVSVEAFSGAILMATFGSDFNSLLEVLMAVNLSSTMSKIGVLLLPLRSFVLTAPAANLPISGFSFFR